MIGIRQNNSSIIGIVDIIISVAAEKMKLMQQADRLRACCGTRKYRMLVSMKETCTNPILIES